MIGCDLLRSVEADLVGLALHDAVVFDVIDRTKIDLFSFCANFVSKKVKKSFSLDPPGR